MSPAPPSPRRDGFPRQAAAYPHFHSHGEARCPKARREGCGNAGPWTAGTGLGPSLSPAHRPWITRSAHDGDPKGPRGQP